MRWPLIRYLPEKTNFTYVRFAGFAAQLSILAVIATFVSMFTGGFRENPAALWNAAEGGPMQRAGYVLSHGFELGIDFAGGTALLIESPTPIDFEELRELGARVQDGSVEVQGTTCRPVNGPPYCAFLNLQATEGVGETVAAVSAALPSIAPGARITSTDAVSGRVSEELFSSGLIALGLAIVLMLIYIWFRFEFQFGIGAVLALFHDVILTLGLFSIFRIEFTLTIIAALLTIIGYSMNDTVVVFDRLRENLRKYKKMPVPDIIDLSINETLSRTIITGLTALMALVGLLYIGGDALAGFAIAMIFGIVIGTYSSIYVAAPAILLRGVKRGEPARTAEAQKSPG